MDFVSEVGAVQCVVCVREGASGDGDGDGDEDDEKKEKKRKRDIPLRHCLSTAQRESECRGGIWQKCERVNQLCEPSMREGSLCT